jgi:hypothetical protein
VVGTKAEITKAASKVSGLCFAFDPDPTNRFIKFFTANTPR